MRRILRGEKTVESKVAISVEAKKWRRDSMRSIYVGHNRQTSRFKAFMADEPKLNQVNRSSVGARAGQIALAVDGCSSIHHTSHLMDVVHQGDERHIRSDTTRFWNLKSREDVCYRGFDQLITCCYFCGSLAWSLMMEIKWKNCHVVEGCNFWY